VVRLHDAGVLGGLAAQQRAPGQAAALGDAGDDLLDLLGHELADGQVVLQEQRLGAADHEVVDDHRDQVAADGVVAVGGLRDGELGAHAVGGGREHRLAVPARAQREEPREAPDAAEHLGPGRGRGERLEPVDGPVAGLDVDPGGGVAGAALDRPGRRCRLGGLRGARAHRFRGPQDGSRVRDG
jgi:hypothetical protein